MYKDPSNPKSNKQNLDTIKCSKLCTEIGEDSSPDEIAVCNLASSAVDVFVNPDKTYNFARLKVARKDLNEVIDINYYPVPDVRNSNMRHRLIGIGVQGLADFFSLRRFPSESEEAALLSQLRRCGGKL